MLPHGVINDDDKYVVWKDNAAIGRWNRDQHKFRLRTLPHIRRNFGQIVRPQMDESSMLLANEWS